MRRDILRSYPVARPEPGSRSCTTASTSSAGSRPATTTSCAPRHRPRPALRRVRRPHHPPEGPAVPAARPPPCCRRTSSSCSAPARPDTPEILAEVTAGVAALQAERDRASSGSTDLLGPARALAPCYGRRRRSSARRSTSRSASSTSRRWPAAPVVGTATGGIPEVVADGVTGRLVPIEQADDGTGTPLDPDKFVADLAADPDRGRVATPKRPPRWAAGGRGCGPERTSAGTSIAQRTQGDLRELCSAAPVRARGQAWRPWLIMPSVLQLTDVSVVRGGTTILDSVNWSVDDDERWVILGPNGAGKTTLLQVAAAMIHPSSGKAKLLDEPLGKRRRLRTCARASGSRRPRWRGIPRRREGPRRRDDGRVLGDRPLERGIRGHRRPPRAAGARRVETRPPRPTASSAPSATASRSGCRSPARS